MSSTVMKKRHAKYFIHFLTLSPESVSVFDSTRLTYAFFSLAGLDILNALDELQKQFRSELITWIYHLYVLPLSEENCGFQGCTSHFIRTHSKTISYEEAHLAMTYSAISSLVILEDNLEKIDRSYVIKTVRAHQQSNGSFCGVRGEEADMRFVFCAACISYILNDFSGIDTELMVDFIKKSINYDGGIGLSPGLESHGGSTFCAVAALHLTSRLDCLTGKEMEGIKRWCIMRQTDGFQGRPDKPPDTCYSFWIGGTLAILNCLSWIDFKENRDFLISTQDAVLGGFSKYPYNTSDPLHAFFGLSGLSLMSEDGLAPIEAALCISSRAFKHLKTLQQSW